MEHSQVAASSEQPIKRVDEWGNTFWNIPNGPLHRLDGPAADWGNGTKSWWANGRRHRLDGPAIERADGDKEWYVNGQCHRLDGPAVEWPDGSKNWYIDGKKLTEQQWTLEVCRRMRDGQ